jgi:hypothetical protein
MNVARLTRLLPDIDPDLLEPYVVHDLNVDEVNPMDVVLAFSAWEALSDEERAEVRRLVADATIVTVLQQVGEHDEVLLRKVEDLHARGIPVVAWLKRQLVRGKATLLAFDQLLREGKRYG